MLDEGDEGVAKLIVIITEMSDDDGLAEIEAALLHAENVTIIGVGMGSEIDDNQMNAIVSDPDADNYFQISGYDQLGSIEDEVARLIQTHMCKSSKYFV